MIDAVGAVPRESELVEPDLSSYPIVVTPLSVLSSSVLLFSLLFSLPIQGGLYSSLSSPGTSCSGGPTDTNCAMVRLPKQCIGPIRCHEIVGRSVKPYYDLALRLALQRH